MILQRLQCEGEEIREEIAELEEKKERLNKTVQDTWQLPEVLLKIDRSKEIEMDLKKLKKKLHRTKVVYLKHSKKMVAFSASDPDCIEEEKWSQRVTNNKDSLESLTTQICEYDEVN